MSTLNLPTHARPGRRRQRGLTLIEVLVSMLVMALGLLGMAALQTTTLRYQLGTAERASLGLLLSDFAERVRINVGASATGPSTAYLRTGSDFNWTKISGALTATAPNCDAGTTVCSPDQQAQRDMEQWLAAVRAQLPQGGAIVSGAAGTGLAVTFAWRDKDFADSPAQCGANTTGMARQTCCPAALAVGNTKGVRCANFTVTP